MFYTTDHNRHGLAHDPFKALVVPRPIGWIGSVDGKGTFNLSPYSFFNIVSDDPKIVMFSSGGWKDSARNARETGVFTTNLVSRPLVEKMNASSAPVPPETDEFALVGLTPVKGRLVDAPYVGEALAVFECRVTEIRHPRDLAGRESEDVLVFGQVVGIHIDESLLRDGRIDMSVARAVGRLGYLDYAEVDDVFALPRPGRPPSR